MKRFLRRLAVAALGNPVAGLLMRPLWQGRASIFMLHWAEDPNHNFGTTSLAAIDDSIKALRAAGANIISLRDLLESAANGKDPEPGSVVFTIDDGYRHQQLLAQRLITNDCTPTIFLVTGFIDHVLWPWDEKLAHCIATSSAASIRIPEYELCLNLDCPQSRERAKETLQNLCKSLPWERTERLLETIWHEAGVQPELEPPEGCEPLSWDEIRVLEAAGADFAPHSVSHRVASQLSDSDSRWEIATSWKRLQHELARPLAAYAWPTGRTCDFGPRDIQFAREAGLLGAVATNNGYARFSRNDADSRFQLDRFAFSDIAEVNLQYGTAIERLKDNVRAYAEPPVESNGSKADPSERGTLPSRISNPHASTRRA